MSKSTGPTAITLVLAGVVTMVALTAWSAGGTGVDAVRMVLRVTARMSLLLFVLAFGAAALARLVPNKGTHWLRRHRRSLGLGFASSHGWHLAAIVTLAYAYPADFGALTNKVTIIAGSATYLFIAAMAATSFDTTARAVGARAWRWTHTVGAHVIWVNFLISEAKRIPGKPAYALGAVLLLAVMTLRIIAARRTARSSAASFTAPPHW